MLECTSRVNPKVNSGLWLITMCHCRFISYNNSTMLAKDIDSRGSCTCVGAEGIWETVIHSSQFYCEPKTALEIFK